LKKIFLLLPLVSYVYGYFPTVDEVFSGKKKEEKVKVIYVDRATNKRVVGPEYKPSEYNNPLKKYEKTDINKRTVQYPVNRNQQQIYKNRRSSTDFDISKTNLRGKAALQEQIKHIDPNSIRRDASRMDIRSGKKNVERSANRVNPQTLGKKVDSSKSMDAVDRLHMMAKCEAEAKTEREKELCWLSEDVKKNKAKQKQSNIGSSNMKMEQNAVMKKYNELYKGNKMYQNPLMSN